MTEKVILASKSLFRPANGMRSTGLQVKKTQQLTLKFSIFLKLREFAFELHQKMNGGASETEIDQLIKEQMKTVYR